jgi:hypothetical protein
VVQEVLEGAVSEGFYIVEGGMRLSGSEYAQYKQLKSIAVALERVVKILDRKG